MSRREPSLRSPIEALSEVFRFYGPRRYASTSKPFNGAVALIQPSDAFEKACTEEITAGSNPDLHGPGAVWAWFVGSPRAFLFGFSCSKRYATRKMHSELRSEFESVAGRKVK
jgi:hypothetical protein